MHEAMSCAVMSSSIAACCTECQQVVSVLQFLGHNRMKVETV